MKLIISSNVRRSVPGSNAADPNRIRLCNDNVCPFPTGLERPVYRHRPIPDLYLVGSHIAAMYNTQENRRSDVGRLSIPDLYPSARIAAMYTQKNRHSDVCRLSILDPFDRCQPTPNRCFTKLPIARITLRIPMTSPGFADESGLESSFSRASQSRFSRICVHFSFGSF